MSIFDDIRASGAEYRLTEEALYAEALREIETGVRRDGLWAKALSDCKMDDRAAQARYIKMRVQSLKDEVNLFIRDMRRTARSQSSPPAALQSSAPVVPSTAESFSLYPFWLFFGFIGSAITATEVAEGPTGSNGTVLLVTLFGCFALIFVIPKIAKKILDAIILKISGM